MNMLVRQYEWVYVTMCYIYCWLQMASWLCAIYTVGYRWLVGYVTMCYIYCWLQMASWLCDYMCYIYCWLQMASWCTIITMIEKCMGTGVWVRVTMVTVFFLF